MISAASLHIFRTAGSLLIRGRRIRPTRLRAEQTDTRLEMTDNEQISSPHLDR